MNLLIRVFAGIVLVLIVSLKLKVFSDWKERARIDFGRTDLLVLAFIVDFRAGVGNQMVGVDRQGPLQ